MKKRFDIDSLVNLTGGDMILSVFHGRYDGIIAYLTCNMDNAAALEDNFNGSDTDWEYVSFTLQKFDWYPIVFVNSVNDAIPELQKKLNDISTTVINITAWKTAVELVSRAIYENKHRKLLGELMIGLKVESDFCDLKKVLPLLWKAVE